MKVGDKVTMGNLELTVGAELVAPEKRPGWDWIVFYLAGDDDEAGDMDVFGAMSIEEAIADAHASLSASRLMGVEPNYTITGAMRADQYQERKAR